MTAMNGIVEGAQAPDVDLETADGRVRSRELRGKTLVLYFYPKDDTSACTKQAVDFTALADQFGAAGAAVVGVSKDSIASHRRFADKHKVTITLASDPEGETIQRFDSWVEKSLYGRKYMGIDRSTFLIDSAGVIRRVWRKVRTPGHAAEVLAAVKAL